MSSGKDVIRVLIVDDIPETRESLKKMLYFEPDMDVVGTAESGEEGIEMAKQFKPHVVLMDINMPGLDGITASEAITREVPFAQIVMMSVQSEADYLRRSMLAGAVGRDGVLAVSAAGSAAMIALVIICRTSAIPAGEWSRKTVLVRELSPRSLSMSKY